jgi:hypothetical protein
MLLKEGKKYFKVGQMYSLLEVDRDQGMMQKVLVKKLTKRNEPSPNLSYETWRNIFCSFCLGEKENFALLTKITFEESDYYSQLELYVCGFQNKYVLEIMFEE